MLRVALLLIAVSLAFAPEARALKQYRCNGMVQYRPCDEAYSPPPVDRSASPRRVRPQGIVPRPPSPKVFDDSFEQVSSSEGVWRGKVKGYGFVQLSLYIYEKGKLIDSRYMGGVELEGQSTFFAFKSMVPIGQSWTWVVRAYL